MILAVDIGNSRITIGLYRDNSLVNKTSITSSINISDEEYSELFLKSVGNIDIDGVIVASVVEELNDRICFIIETIYNIKPVFVSPHIKMNISIKLENNNEIGADRIANGVQGFELYHKPLVVVDFGTATTFDVVNSKGEYIGGIILPGLKTQLHSLNLSTSKLPDLNLEDIDKIIGNSTKTAILSGIVNGNASLIDGMLQKFEKEMEVKPIFIATGGLSRFITKYTNTKFDLIDEDFTLNGLYTLYKINSKVN